MRGLHHVGLVVSNLENSIRFYAENFGFQVQKQWTNPRNGARIALVGLDGLMYELIEYIENPYQGKGCYNHLALLTDDVGKKQEELRRKGIWLDGDAPRVIMGGDARIVFCCGPDGELIELHQRVKEETDEDDDTGRKAD